MGAVSQLLNRNNIKVLNMNFGWLANESELHFEGRQKDERNIRRKNLSDLARVLEQYNVKYWLQGKTQLGLATKGNFLKDHDDDIGVDISNLTILCSKIAIELVDLGFEFIRAEDSMISVIRDMRYIDICLFRKVSDTSYGYSSKRFPYIYYTKFTDIKSFGNSSFRIPEHSLELCALKYPKLTGYRINTLLIWDHGIKYLDNIIKIICKYKESLELISIKSHEIPTSCVEQFTGRLYAKERVPKHIYDKSKHLIKFATEAGKLGYKIACLKVISVSPNNSKFISSDKSEHLEYQDFYHCIHRLKWEIRDRYNPRLKDNSFTHNHIVHVCDKISEVIYLDQLIEEFKVSPYEMDIK